MIKIENVEIWGFEHAIRGMRNPLESWDKSDSDVAFHALQNFYDNNPMADKYLEWNDRYGLNIQIGPNDLSLMRKLYKAGPEHRKFLRQIFVSMDITAPLYWWKEFDTYKVGTVANSCSTMHTIHKKEFTIDDFSHERLITMTDICLEVPFDNLIGEMESAPCIIVGTDKAAMPFSPWGVLAEVIRMLNKCRELYLSTKDKKYWWQIIQLLPSSYNQKRTVTMNYENVVTIIHQRSGHKLDEWNHLCETFIKELPYVYELIFDGWES